MGVYQQNAPQEPYLLQLPVQPIRDRGKDSIWVCVEAPDSSNGCYPRALCLEVMLVTGPKYVVVYSHSEE